MRQVKSFVVVLDASVQNALILLMMNHQERKEEHPMRRPQTSELGAAAML